MTVRKFNDEYTERMARVSRLHYFTANSDFHYLSVEDFEIWKGERKLNEEDRIFWRHRRRELKIICEILLEAYKIGDISLDALLKDLRAICDEKDFALFGKISFQAFSYSPSITSRRRSRNTKALKNHIRFLLEFLKTEKPGPNGEAYLGFPKKGYPGKTYNDRIELVRARFQELGLKTIAPTFDSVTELSRAPRKRSKNSGVKDKISVSKRKR